MATGEERSTQLVLGAWGCRAFGNEPEPFDAVALQLGRWWMPRER